MSGPIRQVLTFPLRLVLVAGLLLASSGGVLCLGDGGRAVIEAICQPCCADAQAVCQFDGAGTDGDQHNSCVDCTDVPLLLSVVSNRPTLDVIDNGVLDLDLSLPVSAAITTDTYLLPPITAAISVIPLYSDAHLRTTVLRC